MKTLIVPWAWMPAAPMLRIITHWTAGGWTASVEDRDHYHIMVQRDGTLALGHHAIPDNIDAEDGDYAAHTRGLNSHSIGVACCGMAGAQRGGPYGPCPLNNTQYEAMLRVVADLATAYKIPVDDHHILNHGDVEATLGVRQRGKWDICELPFMPEEKQVGHYMRLRVKEIIGGELCPK